MVQEAAAEDMSRSLLPLNTLLSWFIIGAASLMGLKVIGLDPSPLLAVGGVSGIVVGFASQSLLLNLIAGISIFLTRPFIVGDIVQLKNNHLLIATGTIINISPCALLTSSNVQAAAVDVILGFWSTRKDSTPHRLQVAHNFLG